MSVKGVRSGFAVMVMTALAGCFRAGFGTTDLLTTEPLDDLSFGSGGELILDFGGIDNNVWASHALVEQMDGRLAFAAAGGSAADNALLAGRLDEQGNLDASFNGVGFITMNSAAPVEAATNITWSADGTLMVAGTTQSAAISALVDGSGAPVTSYGTGGINVSNDPCPDTVANGHIRFDDGSVLLGGQCGGTGQWDFWVESLLPDGSPNPSFGSGGRVRHDIAGFDEFGALHDEIGPGGHMFLHGSTFTAANDFDWAVLRLRPDGTRETGFANNGVFTMDFFGGTDRCLGIDLLADGSILLVGYAHNGTQNIIVAAKLTASGILDTNFGVGGIFSLAAGEAAHMVGAIELPDGRYAMAGAITEMSDQASALMLLHPNGTLDPSGELFGAYTTNLGIGTSEEFRHLIVDRSGRLVAYGLVDTGPDYDIVIKRWQF